LKENHQGASTLAYSFRIISDRDILKKNSPNLSWRKPSGCIYFCLFF